MGIPLAEYNEMTPFEMSTCATVYSDKINNDAEAGMFFSYINAYWQRVETLKSFEEMIGKPKKPKIMTADEMLSNLMGIHAEMGGTTEGGE